MDFVVQGNQVSNGQPPSSAIPGKSSGQIVGQRPSISRGSSDPSLARHQPQQQRQQPVCDNETSDKEKSTNSKLEFIGHWQQQQIQQDYQQRDRPSVNASRSSSAADLSSSHSNHHHHYLQASNSSSSLNNIRQVSSTIL